MRKIIAISGVPGSGKSTLMKKFMAPHSWVQQEPIKLLKSMYCEKLDLQVFGVYPEGEVFGGTDKLGMNCQPNVQEYVKNSTCNILFEGDRLTNMKMYDFLLELDNAEVFFYVIEANQSILESRYAERGSDQSETFLKGRATKINNIKNNMDYWDYTTIFPNNNKNEQSDILDHLNFKLVG